MKRRRLHWQGQACDLSIRSGRMKPGKLCLRPIVFCNARLTSMSVPVVVTDFDGTLAVADVFDELCDRFAAPGWRDYEQRFASGELSLLAAARGIWTDVRVSLAELRAFALTVGALRPGAGELFEAARAGRIELVIASGGLDFYIHALLSEHLRDIRAIYCNRLTATAAGLEFGFPHVDLVCERCAVCKRLALRKHLDATRRVAFCGDGSSDRCAVGVAPELFAVAGSRLAHYCRERGAPHAEFDDYREVLGALGL
jgi:2-hydroxy-3-keto-5-methylthiopentenyl-1-phosphate phosphatase